MMSLTAVDADGVRRRRPLKGLSLRVLGATLLSGALTLSTTPSAQAAGATTTVSIVSGGADRAYKLRIPNTYAQPAGGRPLVLALHGRYQTPTSMMSYTGYEGVAENKNFVAAFPSALKGGWNAGTCCLSKADDMGFIDNVIRDVAVRTPINLNRVYVVGFSNGGMMAYRYGCQRSNRVAGVGIVSGTMVADASFANPAAPDCKPTSPLAMIHVHGDNDTTVKQSGGYQSTLSSNTTASTTSVTNYRVAAGCTGSGLTKVGNASKRTYGGCKTTAASGVQFVRIAGLGHTWTRSGYGYDTSVGVWNFLSPQRSARPAG